MTGQGEYISNQTEGCHTIFLKIVFNFQYPNINQLYFE